MNWPIVRLADVAPTPWKNGGGVTRELLAWPSAQNWICRLSVADVTRNGPFSSFEGVQRWFAVLGGEGVRLTLAQQAHELTPSSAPLCFDGASPVDCELLGGATQDFNLMVRCDRASAQMKRIEGDATFNLDAPKIIAVYAHGTGASVRFDHKTLLIPAQCLAWQSLPAGAEVQVSAAHALWMEIEL